MTAKKNKSRWCFKFSTASTAFPLKLCSHITLNHCFAEAFTATEFSCLLHIFNIKFWFRLAFIITVVKLKLFSSTVILIKVNDFKIFPLWRNLVVFFKRTIVWWHSFRVVSLNPVKCTKVRCRSNFLHKRLCTSCNKVLWKVSWYLEVKFNMVSKSVKIILNRKIFSKVEIVFKLITISIELTVEVLCNKPVWFKKLFRACKTKSAKKKAFKFIVRNSVFLTWTDVIEMIPEIWTKVTCFIFKVAHKSAWIFYCTPFKYTIDRNMEHNRVHILKNVRIKDTWLTHYNPILNSAFNECAFSNSLWNSIMVINRNFDRVATSAPMDRVVTVACFSNSADIANFNIIRIRLSKNCFADALCSTDVCFLCFVRLPVSSRRYHNANMKYIICTCYAFKNWIVIVKVTPNNL